MTTSPDSALQTGTEAPLRELAWPEIVTHNKPGDLWVVFCGGVYDVSEWMYRHPGGIEVYLEAFGYDATKFFNSIGHSDEAWALAQKFKVGTLRADSAAPEPRPTPAASAEEFERYGPATRGPGLVQAGPKLRPLGDAERSGQKNVRTLPEYDWEDVLQHDKPGDFWVVIGRDIFDVSEWIYHHPGGAEVFIEGYGHNLSRAFGKAGHSDEAWDLAQSFKVGRLRPGSKAPARPGSPRMTMADAEAAPAASPAPGEVAREIPWAVRWLVPRGERFMNFPLLNDNDTQLDFFRRFGHIYAVGVPTKKWRLVMVSDPGLLDEVASNEELFGKRVDEINFFAQLAESRGAGISVVSDSDEYQKVRRVMLPWYAPAHQKTQFHRMKELARHVTTVWGQLPDDQPLDMRDWMQRYALEVSGRGACNYDFGLLDAEATPSGFAAAVPESTRESTRRVADPWPDNPILAGPAARARRRKYRRQQRILFETATALVQGRKNTCPVGEQTDLLTRLLATPDPKTGAMLDDATIRDQLLMHLSNGFNGPSITGAWIASVLATHPEVEERLIAEIDSVTGGDPGYDLQYTDLMALPYMTQVIKETLRIYPPMPVTIRRARQDGLLGGYRIRKDDIILIGTLAAQRDERYWGPAPERFDPDQFAMEKVVERPRHAFIPFSVGPRQCMAQEVTFMMLRVALFEIYNRYRLRLAPGTNVVKDTVVTTKPKQVPVIRVPREGREEREAALAARKMLAHASAAAGEDTSAGRAWDRPSEIPETSAFRHLTIAFGSNFGTSKELAERFADRSRIYGFTADVVNLNDLIDLPARDQPWLLVVMTATYTGSPPSNAIAFKSWLEAAEPGAETWSNCHYLVWGLGNSQWNAFLAFPRFVQQRLGELGAKPVGPFAFGDVGSPVWEDAHTVWNDRTWPVLIEMAGARPSEAAAARLEAERAAEEELTAADSNSAMAMSLEGQIVAPTLMTNAVGIPTVRAKAVACVELQAEESIARTRHLEVALPEGFEYTAGDHLGVCPQNDEEHVERLARHLDAALDGVFIVPRSMKARAVPKGVPLQVRNVLTCLVDITAMPTVQLIDLLLEKVVEPAERTKIREIRDVLTTPDGPDSPLRGALRAGGYDVVELLDEFRSCSINIFEFLQVAQPLRPRYYSTSSSPRIHGDGVAHVTVGSHATPVPGMPHRHFRGMSSHYVHTLRVGDWLNVFLDRAEGFHMQDDTTKPMIFVSAGTGYAPMRAFLWERLALRRHGEELGEAALFNGIRSSKHDYIYRDEIEMFEGEGVLQHVHVAMSREHREQKEYVQDRIVKEAALVWRLIDAGAFVYICGSQSMRTAVRAAVLDVIRTEGGLGDGAEAYLERMETEENRYRPDVWG